MNVNKTKDEWVLKMESKIRNLTPIIAYLSGNESSRKINHFTAKMT